MTLEPVPADVVATFLEFACWDHHTHGAGDHRMRPDGITPLWWLPDDDEKAMEVVELLLAAGADPSRRNSAGRTAADWARKRGMIDVARRLAVDDGLRES